MARRERERFQNEGERGGHRARPADPQAAGQRPTRPTRPGDSPAKSDASRRPPQAPQRPRSVAEDPNAYRSPGFQDVDQNPYRIDYAGLPKDVDEADDAAAAPPQAPSRAPSLPRGMLGRNQDRRGTDPNAYRSPAFQDLDRLHQRYGARRRGPPAAPREPVLPEGAPVEEADDAEAKTDEKQ